MWFGIGFVKNQFGCDFHTFQLQLCASSGAGKCQTVSSKWIVPGKCVKREVVFFLFYHHHYHPVVQWQHWRSNSFTSPTLSFIAFSSSTLFTMQVTMSYPLPSFPSTFLCYVSCLSFVFLFVTRCFIFLSSHYVDAKSFWSFSNFIDKRSSCLCILSDSFVGFLFCPFDSVWASFSRPWFLSSFVFILKLPKPHMRTSGWGVGSIQEFSVLLWMDMCFFYRFF